METLIIIRWKIVKKETRKAGGMKRRMKELNTESKNERRKMLAPASFRFLPWFPLFGLKIEAEISSET
jgi:hypothetical protein